MKLNTMFVNSFEEESFWYKFLTIVETKLDDPTKMLSHKEKELLSYVLAGDPYKDYFKGTRRQEVLNHFHMSNSQLSQTRSKLNRKGWLDDMFLTRSIRNVQKEFKKLQQAGNTDLELTLTFVLRLKSETHEGITR